MHRREAACEASACDQKCEVGKRPLGGWFECDTENKSQPVPINSLQCLYEIIRVVPKESQFIHWQVVTEQPDQNNAGAIVPGLLVKGDLKSSTIIN